MHSLDGWNCSPHTKSTTAAETASMILNHVGRFGSPEVIHTSLGGIEQSFATAYSSEENGIVERANQEVLRHLRALLFNSRVHDKWSFEQLPLVQRIMNTVEQTSTGVTPAELILSRLDEWISRQHTLLLVALKSINFRLISIKL